MAQQHQRIGSNAAEKLAEATAYAAETKQSGPPASQFSNCSLTCQQVEEIYEKMPMEGRKLVGDYITKQAPVFKVCERKATALSMSAAHPSPRSMVFLTFDTLRYRKFNFRGLEARHYPPAQNKDSLFTQAMEVLRNVAFPMNMIMARYENACRKGHIMVVDANLELIERFISSQIEQDRQQTSSETKGEALFNKAVSDTGLTVRKQWHEAGLSDQLYRSVAFGMFQLRAEEDPPFFVVYSSRSKQYAVVVCWQCELLQRVLAETPLLAPRRIIAWPTKEHALYTPRPARFCQYALCDKAVALPATDLHRAVLETFENHNDTRARQGQRKLDITIHDLFMDKYKHVAAEEMAAIALDDPQQKEKSNRIVEMYMEKCKEELIEANEEFAALFNRTDDSVTNEDLAFKRCTACRSAYYCSVTCQKNDWNSHMHLCPNLKTV
eukprot:Clim_evm22s144 gene=Clim_evmTU22s144